MTKLGALPKSLERCLFEIQTVPLLKIKKEISVNGVCLKMKQTDLNMMEGNLYMSIEDAGLTEEVICETLMTAKEGRGLATRVAWAIC